MLLSSSIIVVYSAIPFFHFFSFLGYVHRTPGRHVSLPCHHTAGDCPQRCQRNCLCMCLSPAVLFLKPKPPETSPSITASREMDLIPERTTQLEAIPWISSLVKFASACAAFYPQVILDRAPWGHVVPVNNPMTQRDLADTVTQL